MPDFGIYTGYIDCDLAILGLRQQGEQLDQSTFWRALRSVGDFNAGGGLGCTDSSLSLETYGKIVAGTNTGNRRVCTWALRVKDGKFVVLKPKGESTTYWTGELIEESVDPQYLVTTTTAQ